MNRSNTLPFSEPRPSPPPKPILRSETAATTYTIYRNGPALTSHPHKFNNVFHYHHHGSTSSRPATSSTSTTARPGSPARQNSGRTRYMDMLLELDTIPRLHNILASFFTWILLAGFIIFPGTFTSIQRLDNSQLEGNVVATGVLSRVKNMPLLVIAGICCGIGTSGMTWLWWTWRMNYVWLLNRIFMPGCLNSLAGLISTFINVYGQQHGAWSVTAEITAIVTGVCMGVTAILFAVYNFWLLDQVRRGHAHELEKDRRIGENGIMEKVERKAKKPALGPGSVV